MAGNLIRGYTQIAAQSLTLGLLDPALALPDSYLANGANFIKKDGSVAFIGNISMGGNRITGLANGTAATDAITLSQLQAFANSMSVHTARFVVASNVASKTGIPSTGVADGVTAAAGDIAFLTAQTTQSENGPWVISSNAWTRPPDWASGAVESGVHYWLIEPDGTTYKNSKWFLANTTPPTIDTTAVTFTQDLAATVYSFIGGLAQSGNSVSIARGNGIGLDGSNNLTVTSDSARLLQTIAAGIGIKDGVAGQILMANSAGNASYQTLSGDLSITSGGVATVNHVAGSGFLKYTDVIVNETPGGTPNGSLTSFTLAGTPQVSSLQLYKGGQLLKPGAGNDYTISGATITMLTAPMTGDQLQASYVK